MNYKKFSVDFYRQDTLKVAKEILGHFLVRKIDNRILSGKIVEVEAYRQDDPASHSFRGKTERNKIMFMEGGHLYVYFTYGMYFCSNIVTEYEGFGAAVLIRAVEPVSGINYMAEYRKVDPNSNNISNGPGKLCIAFNINKELNGYNLSGNDIYVAENPQREKFKIEISNRIGISIATDKKWRFFISGNRYVSKAKIF